jgi:hypothetical protein
MSSQIWKDWEETHRVEVIIEIRDRQYVQLAYAKHGGPGY